jgi:hypothetical protein
MVTSNVAFIGARDRAPPTPQCGLLDSYADGGIMTSPTGGAEVSVPFAPGAHWQNSRPHEELPTAHVGHAHPSGTARPHLTPKVGDGTVTITGIFKESHGSPDVLPEKVRPKGEPKEESEGRPTGKSRRKGPRRRGR